MLKCDRIQKKGFMRISSFLFLCVVLGANLVNADETSHVPEFMRSFVLDPNQAIPKEEVAFDNVIALDTKMFPIYDKSLEIYKKDFLNHHALIMGLFSDTGGRFILYRPGQPPLEADPVPQEYQIAKSIGHSAMATFVLLSPYSSNPSGDLGWLGSLKAYRTAVETASESLPDLGLKPEDQKLFASTLGQIAAFMDQCIKEGTYTYKELQTFARTIQPDLAKMIDVATNLQVKHWWNVLEQWKNKIGKEWDQTYGLSNSIYVARQNNILFSIMAQFFGKKAMNDRLILLETTDFTTTPEIMMDAFMRIVSDRLIGQVFFKDGRLLDYELLGGSARKVIEKEAADHGVKPFLPPLVPFNSTEWPWKTDPSTGTGPSTMDQIH